MQYRRILALAVLSACAEAGVALEKPDAPPSTGGADASVDSPTSVATDAAVDAPPACTPMTINLLQNANFEATPLATGWTETRYNNEPIVRTDGIAGQSPTTKAWLGGVTGAAAADALHQDILVPASTTALVLTGFYEVRTGETGATIYDTGSIDLVSTTGTMIEPIQAFTNATPTTTWTAINKTFTANVKGTTVRLRMRSTNDILNATSFYFDTMVLNATVCQ
jgi:hypothetical protein